MTYIFDFDGTLVDSMPVFGTTMIRIFEENNLPLPENFIKIITPLGYKGTAEYAIKQGIQMRAEEFVEKALEYNTFEYHHNIPLKEHVREKLQLLKANGHSLNVLTASPHFVLDACLERLGVARLFDNIWSCEDFHRTKAEVEIYREAAQKLGKAVEECIFVDDNLGAVTTAKQAGMQAIGVYDASSEDFAEEMKAAADRYVYSFAQL
ncbi:MAG: HAD family phosphatase [Ruminococcaceae bacterium]|nr:HAD family phosphatase [Oscillospiraceae bacterium]